MKKLQARIQRLEAVLQRARGTVEDEDTQAFVRFTRAHLDREKQLGCQVKEHGRAAVARRLLETGSELEQLALLSNLGHCRHQILLLDALHRQDDDDDLLRWWRSTAPTVLRQLAEGNKVEFAEYHSGMEGATDNVSALRIYEKARARLERHAREQARGAYVHKPSNRRPAMRV
jgi:hypothetical protein